MSAVVGQAAAARRANALGLLSVLLGAALGVAAFIWLVGASGARAGWLPARPVAEPPRPAVGLVERSDNRGQVLFGRYCDSCHTAGLETSLGPSLRSVQFKRQFATEDKISRIVREGGFDMPAFPERLVADEDLAEIAAFVRGLPEETR